ncbi:MAG: glycosyltransferase family 39 protein [Candidatus Scalindua sp.]|nr:glycosyltransferase family 39 protein [Candidatus Scalindua sp.]
MKRVLKITVTLLHSRYWLVLMLLAVSFVGIFDHDLWTSDEPRVAEIGREFLDDDASLAVPTLGREPFLEKPPLYFWCVALSYKTFGGPSASAARIPSVFFGLGTLLFTYLLARKMYGRNSALWSCMVLALSTEYFTITHKSLVDISLVFFVTGTVYWLYLALTEKKDKKMIYYALCYLFATGAFFTKGFLGLALPALVFICSIAWTRQWSELKKARLWMGFLIVGAGISLWLSDLWKEGSWEYISTFLVHNNLQRFMPGTGYSGGHEKPFYYYMCVYWSAFAPWSVLTPAILLYICRKGFQEKQILFPVLWFLSGFLLLSLAETKRSIYIVPLLPPISILTGAWFSDLETRRAEGRLDRAGQWCIIGISVMCVVLFPVLAFKYDLYKSVTFIVFMPVILIGSIAPIHSFIRCRVIKLYGLPILLSMLYLSFVLVSYPYINKHKSMKPFCDTLGRLQAVKGKTIYAFCPDETTEAVIPFYTGNYVTPIWELEEMKAVGRERDALVLVVDKHENRPLYNSLSELFCNTIVSGQTGRRRMVLLSNFSTLNHEEEHYTSIFGNMNKGTN